MSEIHPGYVATSRMSEIHPGYSYISRMNFTHPGYVSISRTENLRKFREIAFLAVL